MQRKLGSLLEDPPAAPDSAAESARMAPDSTIEPARVARVAQVAQGHPRGDNNWLGSSFDLAQGLEVKVMESKLSRETLDELFRS